MRVLKPPKSWLQGKTYGLAPPRVPWGGVRKKGAGWVFSVSLRGAFGETQIRRLHM
jgi:hypothetical protein